MSSQESSGFQQVETLVLNLANQITRPFTFLRAVNKDEHLAAMERHRKDFLVHVRGESFLHSNLVRQKGRITGYLTEDIGLVEFRFAPKGDLHLAMFCPKDAYIYRKQAHKFGVPIGQSVPAGLNVFFDARRMVPPHRGVGYQERCSVLP